MLKQAVIQCVDTGPLESLVVMLRSVGYECSLCGPSVLRTLRQIGCDTVHDVESTMRREGVERPFRENPLPVAGIQEFETCDLYVDIKAHRNGPKIWARYPQLEKRTLWYRINGGEPEIVPGKGDEISPPCPLLTPNLWYALMAIPEYQIRDYGHALVYKKAPWLDGIKRHQFYACYPPFHRFDEYYRRHGRTSGEPPICLVHNLKGWGWGPHEEGMRQLGIGMYGNGSPSGLIPHVTIPRRLSQALAYIHLKTNDAPGYALYEALAAACPVIVSRRLLTKCLMNDLFVHDKTCFVFDEHEPDKVHHCHTPEEIEKNCQQVKEYLERLRDPSENTRIGVAGHRRLKELMWSSENQENVSTLTAFFQRNFP